MLFSKNRDDKRLLAGAISFSIILHLFMGRYNWYNRYEIYIWSVTVLTVLYLCDVTLSVLLAGNQRGKNLIKMTVIAGLGVFLICKPYVCGLITLPFASNNIYEQQYQMHRFAVNYYDKPIAINDLGYVSYRNNNYVLDLEGLSSLSALVHRKHSDSQPD